MSRPSLNDLAAFAAVAQHRSFRKAADTLGVSRSALSHTLTGLERTLGLRLLNRTTRSVSLTQAGARLLAHLGPVLQELDTALDSLAEARGPGGTLRINANKGGAAFLLREVIPSFLTRHPHVEIDLVTDGRLVDIVEQGFDAGVRLFEAVPQDMIAVRFGGDVRFVSVASPGYLQGRSPPTTPGELRSHTCIRQRLPSGKAYRWEFSKDGMEVAIDVPGTLTLDDNDLIADAAVRGLGIAYLPESFARESLKSGQLVTVLGEWCPPIPGLALYYPRNRHLPSALRAFIDTLKAVDQAAEASPRAAPAGTHEDLMGDRSNGGRRRKRAPQALQEGVPLPQREQEERSLSHTDPHQSTPRAPRRRSASLPVRVQRRPRTP